MMDEAAQSKRVLPMEAVCAVEPGPCAPQGAAIGPTNSAGGGKGVGATGGGSTAGTCVAAVDFVGATSEKLAGGVEGTAGSAANEDTTGEAGENGDGMDRGGKAVCFVKLNPGAENNSGHIGEGHSSSDSQNGADGAAVDATLITRPNIDGLSKSSGHEDGRSKEAQVRMAGLTRG